MQHCGRRAARSRYTGDGVFNGCFVYDLGWQNIPPKKVNDKFASAMTRLGFCVVGGGGAGESHGCHSEKFANECHSIGGKLTAAGTGPGTRNLFQCRQTLLGHFSAAVSAHSLEDILNRNGMPFKLARDDCEVV